MASKRARAKPKDPQISGFAAIFNAINSEASREFRERGPCPVHGAPYPKGLCYLCARGDKS